MLFKGCQKKCLGVLFAGAAMVLTGCSHEDDLFIPAPGNTSAVQMTVDASNYDDWVYYSFESGAMVTVEDPRTSTDWDLGFRRYHLATNCGDSGPGEGGAISVGEVGFDSISEAPESDYVSDELTSFTGMQGPYEASVSPVLTSWASRDGMPPTWSYSGEVYIVKTAAGKYVKIQFSNYYNLEGLSGHISFNYLFQSDGGPYFSY